MAEKYLNSYNFRIAKGAAMQRCHRSLEALQRTNAEKAEQSILVRDLQKNQVEIQNKKHNSFDITFSEFEHPISYADLQQQPI